MVSSSSVRQSPPPVTDSRRMPNGAILSPPASSPESPCSDEEDGPEIRGRQVENLKALHDAISKIPQHRETSPNKAGPGDVLVLPSHATAIVEGMRHSFSTGALDELAAGRRRAAHARSATEPNALTMKSEENSLTTSEEDSDEESQRKPQMVRKKSGELVRPALRASSHRRPSSMPGTPTFSKVVHFDSHLEHVRHFLQVDRPLAVSTGSSPADTYESDTEYPFSGASRSPPFEWEVTMTNLPVETPARKAQAVRLERVWLSNDQKCLTGSIVVLNLAFQKHVTCRFTLDYWKTTSEVVAEYAGEIQPKETPAGHDRFNFTIKVSDISNLESKTLYFCIRYNVAGKELWDNNGGMNFQVDFKKRMLPQNGKKGVIGAASRAASGLPRSSRRASPSTAPRPKSMPVGLDEFGEKPKLSFDQSIHDYLGESAPTGLRLKGVKSSASIASDNLSSRLSAPSGQAFANRYDFGASLTAAVKAAKATPPPKSDGLYMKPHRAPTVSTTSDKAKVTRDAIPSAQSATVANKTAPSVTSSPGGASISSSSYEELVNKYCFFGSKPRQSSVDDGFSTNSTNSSIGSPVQGVGSPLHHVQQKIAPPSGESRNARHPTTAALSVSVEATGSPEVGQSRASSASGPRSGRSPSPASLVGSFSPFADASPSPYQHLQDRFPFSGAETHPATAIRG